MDRYTILEEAVLSTNSDAIIAADKEGTIFLESRRRADLRS